MTEREKREMRLAIRKLIDTCREQAGECERESADRAADGDGDSANALAELTGDWQTIDAQLGKIGARIDALIARQRCLAPVESVVE
jgi:hypothetical protein